MDIVSASVQIVAAASKHAEPEITLYLLATALIFITELALFYIPGFSLSSLLIALCGLKFGFVPTLMISAPPVMIAHFILRKDVAMFSADLITIIPMIAFASEFGALVIEMFGWGLFGAFFGLVKWGMATAAGVLFGRNIAKRIREFFVEPIVNYFVFTHLLFLFAFLM